MSKTQAVLKERPILFSGPMVRAILEGRKTQTRRIIKPQPMPYAGGVHPKHIVKHPAPYIDAYCSERKTESNPRGMSEHWCWWTEDDRMGPEIGRCPYGKPGERLWVKESHWFEPFGDWPYVFFPDGSKKIVDQAHADEAIAKYRDVPHTRPSIHLYRWASRILLEVTAVRVERLQDISHQDVLAEGIEESNPYTHGVNAWITGNAERDAYRQLWESINGSGSWDANPWVWVLEFKRGEGR